MATFNIAKTTLGPSSAPEGSVVQSLISITNDTPAYSNDYGFQIGMGDWTQRVPSVQPGQNAIGDVGIRFVNAGAVAGLNGQLEEPGSALSLRNFTGTRQDGSDAAVSFVARVYAGTNNFAPLIATFPGTDLVGAGVVVPPFAGTDFYIEIEALLPNILMNTISVGEATSDVLSSVTDLMPTTPIGITRLWQASHSLDNALLPAVNGTGDIVWNGVFLPAGESITINVFDTVPNAGVYQNDAEIQGMPGDNGVWASTAAPVTILPPPPDLADCGGAWDIQGRQAFLRGTLKEVLGPDYAIFRVFHAGTNVEVWSSDPVAGDGSPAQAVEVLVPFGAQVLQPGTQYTFQIDVYTATGDLITSSGVCDAFTTQANYRYLLCGDPWTDDLIRHAIPVTNPDPTLANPSGAAGRTGPQGTPFGMDAFNVTYEYWNGTAWVTSEVRDTPNSYGVPAPVPNPRLFGLDSTLGDVSFTNLAGDGRAYPVRLTLRNGANEILERIECSATGTARVPPLQCPDSATMTDNGGVLEFGPVDRNQFDYAERDRITVQARRAGTNEPFGSIGTLELPNGVGSAYETDTVNIPVAGLIPGTAYDVRVVYQSDPGFPAVGYQGSICQAAFTTTGVAPIAPSAECSGATNVTLTGATINGSASADAGHTAHLEWGVGPNGPFNLGSSPPTAISGEDVPLVANLSGLDQATRYYYRVVVQDSITNSVVATSGVCTFQTRAPNAFITPTSSAECPPPTNDVEEGEPPMDVTVTHTLTHSGGLDPITGDVSVLLTSSPTGTEIVSWTATTVGTVTGSALAGTTDPDETITINPGSSITYQVVYHVPGPSGGDLRSTINFDGPGADQIWQASSTCRIANRRLDCDPSYLDMTAIPRDTEMRQFVYDGVTYNLTLNAGWTVEQLVDALNAQTPGKFSTSADGNILLNPQSRWGHGDATFTYIEDSSLIDFGTGGTDGNRVSSPDTTYTFEPDGMILDGFYAITSFQDTGLASFNTNAGNITADATGDPNGNAMIFNASFEPGEFARITIPTTAGLRYGTSFWVVNTNDPSIDVIQPNVTVRIEDSAGNVLGTIATGNVSPPAVWKQFLADIIAADAETTFVFVNNAPGGGGNDLAIDQIEAGAFVTENVPFVNGACPPTEDDEPLQRTVCTSPDCNIPVAWPFALPPCVQPCSLPAEFE